MSKKAQPADAIDRVDVVYETQVGSTIHNLHLEGQDDRDQMGVFIELPPAILGLHRVESIVHRTQPDGVRSGPGDLDRTLYGLRKFCGLALKGNPTILLLFFVPPANVITTGQIADELRDMADDFASLRAVDAFLGYLKAQRERMTGKRGQKRTKRPELVEAHGYDTKYAMHAARLARQGVEYATTGRISLPMIEADRAAIMAIRRGEMDQTSALTYIAAAEAELKQARYENPLGLPKHPNTSKVNDWLWRRYLAHWIQRDLAEHAAAIIEELPE